MALHIYADVEQGTEEWHDLRRGMVTASVVGQLITPTRKVADNDTSRGLIATLAAERVTNESEPSFTNRDMERGRNYEPVIRARYAEVTGVTVQQVGLAVRTLDNGARLGASPDGLIGGVGGLEIKAPRSKGHVVTVCADEVPANYMAQVQASLLVLGREWWDYAQAAAGRLYIKRVFPDQAWHEAITAAVIAAENAIEKRTSDYLAAAALLPTIDPYVDPYDLEGLVF